MNKKDKLIKNKKKRNKIMCDFKALGNRIKIERDKLGFSQEILAEISGLSPQHISHIETGNSNASTSSLIKIANALNVSTDTLLCDSLNNSINIYNIELNEVLKDCSIEEVRIILDIAKSTKESIKRNIKIKQKDNN